MTKIYISYSRQNRDFVSELTTALKAEGYEIIIDDDVLAPGQEWRAVLDDGLKAADVFVVILSEESLASQYSMMELGTAKAFASTTGRPLILPVLIDAVQIPLILQNLQTIVQPDRNVKAIVTEIGRGISIFKGQILAKESVAEKAANLIQSTAPQYIGDTINALEKNCSRNNWAALIWHSIGFGSLVLGVASVSVIYVFHPITGTDWLGLTRSFIVNVVTIGFLGACARYAFSLGKSYKSEALKASDRIHAIRFGEFYLKAFGNKIIWDELKEVFAHWNIDRASTFSTLDVSQIDPQLIGLIANAVGAATKKT